MQPEAILFDLDGTLVERDASIQKYAQQFVADFNAKLSTLDLDQILSVLIRADGHGYRSVDRPIEIADTLLRGVSASVADSHWRRYFPSSAVAAPTATKALAELKHRGIPMGLVTNGSVLAQSTKLETLGWTDKFVALIISEEHNFKKPDPRIFKLALEQMKTLAARTWFVGDHPINDVWGAEQVGMQGFLVPGGPTWPEGSKKCGTQIKDLDELTQHLDSI